MTLLELVTPILVPSFCGESLLPCYAPAGGLATGLPLLYHIKAIKFVLAFCPGGCYNVPIANTTVFPESGAVVIKIPVAFAILIDKAPRQNRRNQP
jgi:hypothetical protein